MKKRVIETFKPKLNKLNLIVGGACLVYALLPLASVWATLPSLSLMFCPISLNYLLRNAREDIVFMVGVIL